LPACRKARKEQSSEKLVCKFSNSVLFLSLLFQARLQTQAQALLSQIRLEEKKIASIDRDRKRRQQREFEEQGLLQVWRRSVLDVLSERTADAPGATPSDISASPSAGGTTLPSSSPDLGNLAVADASHEERKRILELFLSSPLVSVVLSKAQPISS
jgi:hypothetical protein